MSLRIFRLPFVPSGYQISDGGGNRRVQHNSPAGVYRRGLLENSVTLTGSWFTDERGYQYARLFYRYQTKFGALPFLARVLWAENQLTTHRAYIRDFRLNGIQGGNHQINVTLEVERRSSPPIVTLRYATVGSTDYYLDLYKPNLSTPVPVFVYAHGGGFRKGARNDPGDVEICAIVQEAGYAIASFDYPLNSTLPDVLWHAYGAKRFLASVATEHNLDKNLMFACGTSAGGILMMMAGVLADDATLHGTVGGNTGESNVFQGIIANSGTFHENYWTNLSKNDKDGLLFLLGCGALTWNTCTNRNIYLPDNRLDVGDPDCLMVHGSDDTRLIPSNVDDMFTDMNAVRSGMAEKFFNTNTAHGTQNWSKAWESTIKPWIEART